MGVGVVALVLLTVGKNYSESISDCCAYVLAIVAFR